MMKKILGFILITALFVSSLFAATSNTFKEVKSSVKLSVTVQNVIYAGVSKSMVSSFVLPKAEDRIDDIGFTFDQYNSEWVTTSAYIYAISFVSKYVTITLTPAAMTDTVNKNTTLAYSLVLTGSGSSACKNAQVNSSSLSAVTLCEENADNTAESMPRVMCWQFQMKIPSSSVNTASYNSYQAEFKLGIKTNG